MPPFGFDNDRVGLLQSSFSEEIDIRQNSDGIDSGALKNLLQRFEEERIPNDLADALRDLFHRATDFSEKIRNHEDNHALMNRAVDNSIRIVLAEILDQVALILDLEGNQRNVVADLTRFSIDQAFHYFNRLESLVLEANFERLRPFLEEFSLLREGSHPIRVCLTSKALAFEFVAGQVDTAVLSRPDECHLGLRATATPYMVVKTDALAVESSFLQKYSDCKLKINYGSHKKLFTSSGSGIMGEAIVRIYVNPGKEVKIPKEGKVWGQPGECDKLELVQARA